MIKVIPLLENTKENPECRKKHGLSLYIETPKHKILFDLGPNDLFIKNAIKLGVKIEETDTVIISHGHIDHCGGLGAFLKRNSTAKIYIRPQALDKHYVKFFGIPFYAGINKNLVNGERFVFTNDFEVIDDELTLFSGVRGTHPLPSADKNLFVKKSGRIIPDDFSHEQNLIIDAYGRKTLFCGCSHAGIVNIVDKALQVCGSGLRTVVGGFHLFEPTTKRYEKTEYITAVTNELKKYDADFYTCHCTGVKAYDLMKKQGLKLDYLHTGTVCELYK